MPSALTAQPAARNRLDGLGVRFEAGTGVREVADGRLDHLDHLAPRQGVVGRARAVVQTPVPGSGLGHRRGRPCSFHSRRVTRHDASPALNHSFRFHFFIRLIKLERKSSGRQSRSVWTFAPGECKWESIRAIAYCSNPSRSGPSPCRTASTKSPLHRHGARPAAHSGRDARRQSRGRMGRGLHRVLLPPPDFGRPTLPFRLDLGRRRYSEPRGDGGRRASLTARSPASSCGTAAATSRTSPAANPASACARCPRARIRFNRGAWTRRTCARSANGTSRRLSARKAAGFDIIYVYPSHGYLVSEFLSRSLNERTDEYGGSLVNRVRLFRELLEETRAAVGDRCAVRGALCRQRPWRGAPVRRGGARRARCSSAICRICGIW